MNIVPHHHHSCEAASSKIQRFFAEFHVGQILRSCNAYKLGGFAAMAIFLVAFEAVFRRRSFYQRKKDAPESIPFERDTFYRFLKLLRHPLAQVHAAPGHSHHSEGHRAADERSAQECPHHRRLAVQPQPLQESRAAGSRLRPCQRHVHEGLSHAHARLERQEYPPAAQPLSVVLVIEAAATAGRFGRR